jgi:hypothetical protein
MPVGWTLIILVLIGTIHKSRDDLKSALVGDEPLSHGETLKVLVESI